VPALVQGTSSQPFGYAGQQTDAESGFQYLRARMDDPKTGRFLPREPVAATPALIHPIYGQGVQAAPLAAVGGRPREGSPTRLYRRGAPCGPSGTTGLPTTPSAW
jgi:RHS repeat-associated protein